MSPSLVSLLSLKMFIVFFSSLPHSFHALLCFLPSSLKLSPHLLFLFSPSLLLLASSQIPSSFISFLSSFIILFLLKFYFLSPTFFSHLYSSLIPFSCIFFNLSSIRSLLPYVSFLISFTLPFYPSPSSHHKTSESLISQALLVPFFLFPSPSLLLSGCVSGSVCTDDSIMDNY